MRNLNDYISEELNDLFDRCGVIFAHNNDQYQRQAKTGVRYIKCHSGMFIPKDQFIDYLREYSRIIDDGIKMDKKDHTDEEIVKRELRDKEAHIRRDISEVVESLQGYGINREFIQKTLNITYQ